MQNTPFTPWRHPEIGRRSRRFHSPRRWRGGVLLRGPAFSCPAPLPQATGGCPLPHPWVGVGWPPSRRSPALLLTGHGTLSRKLLHIIDHPACAHPDIRPVLLHAVGRQERKRFTHALNHTWASCTPSTEYVLGSGLWHFRRSPSSPAVVDATFIRSSASPGIAACTVAVALPVSVWARHPILARTHHPHKVPWKSMRVNRPWLASSALSLAAPTPTEPALEGGPTMSACGTTSMPI